jgi:hypothetical protein
MRCCPCHHIKTPNTHNSIGKLPHGTILLSSKQLFVPQKDAAAVKRLVKSIPGIEQTEWTAPKRAQGVAQVSRRVK